MKVRNAFLLAFIVSALLFQMADLAWAEDWRNQYPAVTLGVVTVENEADLIARYKPIREYLIKELGLKEVNWYAAKDYAGIIEGIKDKKIEIAHAGPLIYAQCWQATNQQVEPLVGMLDEIGNFGYYSVIIVKNDSTFQKIDDLKGAKVGWADPNSASGYEVPRFFLSEMGIDVDKFFGSAAFSGSHENSIIGLVNGVYDAVATGWNSDTSSLPLRMEQKGIIKPGQWRIIWKSPNLPSGVWTMPVWLPVEMRQDFKKALLSMKDKDPQAWQKLTDGKNKGYTEVTHAQYEPIVRMNQANQEKKSGK